MNGQIKENITGYTNEKSGGQSEENISSLEIWQEEKKQYCNGWHTWNNDSILSYINPLDGKGIRLCVKDYKNAAFLENILIGEDGATVIPRAHAYDDSYTHVSVEWKDNKFEVYTSCENGELYILVSVGDERIKPSTLLIQGLSLYNLGATVSKKNASQSCLILDGACGRAEVYCTESENGELYVPLNTPYLAVTMKGEIGISTGSRMSVENIRTIVEKNRDKHIQNVRSYGEKSELYSAMQTAQAWDTIYDRTMQSPITTVSRIWNKQWGGYVLFCWDTYFGALMQSIDNRILAYSNVFAITDSITEDGFVPNYTCQNGFKSFDRSQPPVGSAVCLEIYRRYREKWFLEVIFDKFLTWNRWFYNRRRTENGLLAWGSNPYELYYDHHLEHDGVDDWQGASYESGLDNSPMYEATPFDKENHILMLDDVGLTGLYIMDCHALHEIAVILDRDEADEIKNRCEEMEEKLEELWDEETGLYLNRRVDTGVKEHRLTPFHFHVLFSGKITDDRVRRIVEEHLLNPDEFWTEYPIPSVAKSDPAYVNQTYWQGRVWAPMNYLVYMALKASGQAEVARLLAEKSAALILKEWLQCGHIHENYDPETGEGCNSERSDRFYHWGGLLAYMSVNGD